ncbi:acyl transferase/acyl hydrolase/lysophospholipase, partial [Phialemonium atrogriseum]
KHSATSSLSHIVRGLNNLALSWRDGTTDPEREDRRQAEERQQILAARMHNARTMKEWETAARELDTLEGNDEWKLDDSTGDYQPEVVEARLKELDEARTNCDIANMLYLLRTAFSRDLAGMGNIDLYRHSYVGTKRLIERYVDSAVNTIDTLVEKSAYASPAELGPRDLLSGALYARQSFGRSALLLSGGATFGMAHIGVIKAMFEANLLPRIISGASAGSIVCSVLCTRTDEEIPAVLREFPYGDLSVFEEQDREDGIADHIRRLLTEGSWSDIKHLTRVLRGVLGDITFQEAYNRTRRICNIPVSSPSIYELPRLLNYVTAPNVMIRSAVAASCSVPFVFNAASLLTKDPETGQHISWNPTPLRFIDGSVDNDLPMSRLAEMFNINHFIVSQVNPHVVPFLSKDDHLSPAADLPGGRESQSSPDYMDWLQTLTALAKDEALHRLQFLTELGIFPNLCTKLRSVLSQKYSGDITILPEISPNDLSRILKNPTPDFMLRNCLIGEKATWPKLSRIRDRCAIELALDRAVHALRARVVFSESQVDLRRLVTGSEHLGAAPEPSADVNRSHPSSAIPVQHGDATQDQRPYHHRRGSGSNIQLLARQRRVQQGLESVMTDEDTEEEETMELSLRRGAQGLRLGNRANVNKPRLKRAVKSHFHLPA